MGAMGTRGGDNHIHTGHILRGVKKDRENIGKMKMDQENQDLVGPQTSLGGNSTRKWIWVHVPTRLHLCIMPWSNFTLGVMTRFFEETRDMSAGKFARLPSAGTRLYPPRSVLCLNFDCHERFPWIEHSLNTPGGIFVGEVNPHYRYVPFMDWEHAREGNWWSEYAEEHALGFNYGLL